MCDLCEHPHEPDGHEPDGAPETAATPARIKLWAIPPRLHCSIIGTCLTRADLAQAMRRHLAPKTAAPAIATGGPGEIR